MGWPGEQQCQAAHSPARLPHGPHQQCSLQRLATPASLGLPADGRMTVYRWIVTAATIPGCTRRRCQMRWAELDEEEQSLDRLRRWYRDIKVRDLFGAPAAIEAEQRLKHCAERLEDYADRVYQAVHQP